MRKPLVIIVSGAPGSGKSTLARAVADRMRLPHIERDVVVRGLERTLNQKLDRGKVAVPRYFRVLCALIENEISFVTDGTLYKGISEGDIKQYITPHAWAINLHARAKNEHQRFYDREMNREGHSSAWVYDHMKHLEEVYEDSAHPLELGIPVWEIDTNDGFKPSLSEIVAKIEGEYDDKNHEASH